MAITFGSNANGIACRTRGNFDKIPYHFDNLYPGPAMCRPPGLTRNATTDVIAVAH
ncbi:MULTISPECIES: hypothetical protein [Cupriavidus]|uniref:Uncharacterized protein n=1 Tax=Cupriavidus alkaliphilus TaxID=942866 RepID=A0A7W4VFE7_9BURK|nr:MULTISPECIES: hypothetical protein [Cupriavidus]MBB3009880.1 hypothetical protein [Cupriavidus alkaliphilus]